MNGCTDQNKNGDCLTRNPRLLCDYCHDLLSDDEHTIREISFYVSDLVRKAQRQLAKLKKRPANCLTLRPNEDRTCIERHLTALCGFCVSSMAQDELLAYGRKIVEARIECRQYWDEYEEATEYLEELKASGAKGIDYNLELCTDNDDYAYIVDGLFNYSRPCFIRLEAGGSFSGMIEARKPHSTGAPHAENVPLNRGSLCTGPVGHHRCSIKADRETSDRKAKA